MKIVFFNRFFHPDASATSQILSDLAFALAEWGCEVHVVTSRVPGAESACESIRGVTVHRVARATSGTHGLFRRALAYIGYYRGAWRTARRILFPGDIAVVKTDPPLLASAIAPLAKRRGAKLIVWLQDLFPEVAREYGLAIARGALGSAFHRMRNESLAIADAVVAIGELMAKRVRALGCVPAERLHVIHNWADGGTITPLDSSANPLRPERRLDDAFVVEYSGNLGRVHEFGTILDAARLLRGHDDVRFVIVGRGPRLGEVTARIAREELRNVSVLPYQDRSRLAQSLSLGDVHLAVLRPEFEGLVQPSKLYGIMAAGRPTIFIGSVTGETAAILSQFQCGVTLPTGDGQALALAILEVKNDPAARAAMGENARRAFEARYDMPLALARWRSLLEDVAGNSRA